MPASRKPIVITRRDLLKGMSLAALAAACGTGQPTGTGTTGAAPTGGATTPRAGATTFTSPSTQLSGDLSILMWSHFVPSHDEWFDPFVQEWGQEVGVNATVDHINTADVPARISAEIQAGEGHDLIQHIAPIPQYEPSVMDLRDVTEEASSRFGEQVPICERSSLNPTTEKFYAYSPSYVPDPANYRRSLWEQVDLPNGPATYDELLTGGSAVRDELGVQLGIGMSQEIDSNMAMRGLMWSFGGFVQDENENVVINSEETIAAVEYMQQLFEGAMTPEVFAWNAASNNQGLISGELSYILNSISAYRSAQEANPEVSNDVFFGPALSGPGGQLVATHVMYNWIIPNHAANPDAAKEFLLHYTENFAQATDASQLYDFPAFGDLVPELPDWLANDPFGSEPADKLSVLADSLDWSTNVGHPGPSSAAIGEVFATFIIPNMMARAARGEQSPADSVAQAESEITPIFDRWRQEGLVGGGSA